jgi:hypothetical protein
MKRLPRYQCGDGRASRLAWRRHQKPYKWTGTPARLPLAPRICHHHIGVLEAWCQELGLVAYLY